ncbi:unnamed protein product [Closterium sp. NIES-64]|nr:unnamed protein product [Closterium sp. NIES-64]CAI5991603.1 unnamed protein product [Closterium sp. NIES-65]
MHAEMKEGGATHWEGGREGREAGAEGEEAEWWEVEVCLDVGSPYSHVALEILLRYRHVWNVRLLLRPVLLGAILRATGNAMPSAVPARGAWLQHDMERTAAFARLPRLSPPPGFGSPRFSTLRCQRLLTALALQQGYDSPQLLALTRALFKAIWTAPPPHRPPPSAHPTSTTTHTVPIAPASASSSSSSSSSTSDISPPSRADIAAPAFLRHACSQASILPAHQDALLAAAATPAVKQALTASTHAAIQEGAFGVPTLFIRPTTRALRLPTGATLAPSHHLMLFGSDRFEQLAWLLGLPWHGPNPPLAAL